MSTALSPSQPAIIQTLLDLPEDLRKSLVNAFAQAPMTTSVKKYAEYIAAAVAQPGLPVRDLVHLFISLKVNHVREGTAVEKFAAEFKDEIRMAKPQGTGAYWEKLNGDIAAILSSGGLVLLAKSLDLMQGNARVFTKARILTDVRPVFGDDVTRPPLDGVVIHTLKLSFYSNDNEEDFHMALDRGDLLKLREVIDRALAKETTLLEAMEHGQLRAPRSEEVKTP